MKPVCIAAGIAAVAAGLSFAGSSPLALEKAEYAYKTKTYVQARLLFAAAELADSAFAVYRLALMNELGLGGPQDFGRAFGLYKKAAEMGHVKSQAAVARFYEEGRAVSRDMAKAFEWYRRAAGGGHAGSQCWLGLMYYLGDIAPQDYAQAYGWFLKSAIQGDGDAQYHLAAMYYTGTGVKQDYVLAYKWARLSAYQVDRARDALKKIKKKMKFSEVRRAERLVKAYILRSR